MPTFAPLLSWRENVDADRERVASEDVVTNSCAKLPSTRLEVRSDLLM